jgi:glucosamine 6-phosphate synthetase-like amidotransferase/phosphosugar isomerase protein
MTYENWLPFHFGKAINENKQSIFSGEARMCGIFGFILKKPLSLKKAFAILKKLEASKYPDENEPVGGYGAGVAIMLPDGDVICEKVGKNGDFPAAQLEEIMKGKTILNPKLANCSVMIGHVRFPSPENMPTVKFKEAAQPYVENFERDLTVVSAHNGKVENCMELRSKLKTHVFESEKIGFVDSEVIPHYFGKLLNESETSDTAAYELLSALKGSNVAALLQIDNENATLHLIHRGKARGLTVWSNDRGEVIFCSRPEPVEEELKSLLAIGKFKEKAVINWKEDAGLKLSFPAIFE